MIHEPEEFPLKVLLSPEDKGAAAVLADGLAWLQGGSLRFATQADAGTGAIWLFGDNELELDRIVHHLLKERGVKMRIGAPTIPYRATIQHRAEESYMHEVKERGQQYVEGVRISVDPDARDVAARVDISEALATLGQCFLQDIQAGVQKVLMNTLLERLPLYGAHVKVAEVQPMTGEERAATMTIAAKKGLRRCLKLAGLVLLEPIMRVEVHVPDGSTAPVIGDIQSRRGRILRQSATDNDRVAIMAEVPMTNLLGYINSLRSMTEGAGSFEATLSHYQEVHPPNDPDDAPSMALAM